VVGRLATGIAGLVILLAVAAVAVGAALGFRLSAVLSGSMRPTLAPGAAVVTRPVPVTSVRPGMIVVFVPPRQSVPYAHRVVQVSGDPDHPMIRTRGDANPAPDGWKVRLAGPTVPEVVAAVPEFGRVIVFFHRPGAFLALAGPLIALAGISTLIVLSRPPASSSPTAQKVENHA
jgi:signal peptidase I